MTANSDIVIIGAGAAGVGAARRLAGSALSSVILEATARVGGRAWTCDVAGMRLDLGCGWLHSADRNPWTRIAEASAFAIERGGPPFRQQHNDLGFSQSEQAAAKSAFAAWTERIESTPPASDCAADALEPGGEWNDYIHALSGFINGVGVDELSVADYLAYETASTGRNWRVPAGYGTLIAASLPHPADLRLSTPALSVELKGHGVEIATPVGSLCAKAAILTVSTAVLGGSAIRLPAALDPWRHAAASLPLGRDEKLFLEIVGESTFEPETRVIGDPRDRRTGVYHIRPFGWNVIEGFVGGEAARMVEADGPAAGFSHAVDQLAALFGSSVRRSLRPLVASSWGRTTSISGAYSHAVPGHASARRQLAQPFEERLFFAGEATHASDFSTAHGAYESGVRAAEEVIAALGPGTRAKRRPIKA